MCSSDFESGNIKILEIGENCMKIGFSEFSLRN